MTDIADVTDVLLVDGWHEVCPSSFRVGMYEIYSSLDKPDEELSDHFQLPMAAFSFRVRDTEVLVEGPLPSVLAIKRRHRNGEAPGSPVATVRMTHCST